MPGVWGALVKFISVGGLLMDFLRQEDGSWLTRPGGSAWNVARVMARLGITPGFMGAISTDPFGETLLEATLQAGIRTDLIQRTPAPTSLSFVFQSHPATYAFRAEGGSDRQLVPFASLCRTAKLVYLGGISVVRPPLLHQMVPFVQDLVRQGIDVAYDPNFRAQEAEGFRSLFWQILPFLKHIKVSNEDLSGLKTTVQDILKFKPDLQVLLTKGSAGAELHTTEAVFRHAGYTVNVRDTVGAGDASMAGLLYHLLSFPEAPPSALLAFALGCGAVACTQPGAHAPSLSEVHTLMEENACQKP